MGNECIDNYLSDELQMRMFWNVFGGDHLEASRHAKTKEKAKFILWSLNEHLTSDVMMK